MGKVNKTQVSENAPELVLNPGEQTAETVVNDATETQTGEASEAETVEQSASETVVNDAAETQTGEENKDLVWIKVLLPLAGKFLLPNDPGHEIEIDPNQAQAIVDAGYGEYIENKEVE